MLLSLAASDYYNPTITKVRENRKYFLTEANLKGNYLK